MKLAEQSLAHWPDKLINPASKSVSIEYEGHVALLKHPAQCSINVLLMGLLQPSRDSVNMVNAPVLAKDRGIKISETRRQDEGDYHTLLRIKIETRKGPLHLKPAPYSATSRASSASTTWFLEAELAPRMLFTRNEDKPGFVGRLGTKLGESKINIANFNLGRSKPGANDRVSRITLDNDISAPVVEEIRKLPGVVGAVALRFEG